MLLLYRSSTSTPAYIVSIYIPLCFYFIDTSKLDSRFRMIFTFHYASTLSIHLITCILSFDRFTFHYASTLSNSASSRLSSFIHLHSTMLLLYLLSVALRSQIRLIYIPLCFYFICRLSHCPYKPFSIYIPLCFYFIPSPFSPSTFFNTVILFVYPLSA